MNDVSIIINGERYDAVDDTSCCTRCDFYDNEQGCESCIIGMVACAQLIGIDGIFKKSTKSFER